MNPFRGKASLPLALPPPLPLSHPHTAAHATHTQHTHIHIHIHIHTAQGSCCKGQAYKARKEALEAVNPRWERRSQARHPLMPASLAARPPSAAPQPATQAAADARRSCARDTRACTHANTHTRGGRARACENRKRGND